MCYCICISVLVLFYTCITNNVFCNTHFIQVKDIAFSAWGAVSEQDPLSPYYEMFGSNIKGVLSTFVADAVIANPPVGKDLQC